MPNVKKSPAKKSPARKKPGLAPPTKKGLRSADLAQLLGVTLTPRLKPDAMHRLRKAYPGYVGLLDDAAAQLDHDATLLGLGDIQPAALRSLQERQKDLAAKEALVEAVYRSVYEQRMQGDDVAMGMLLKIARRIGALREEDPELPARWKFLLDFLAKFKPGRGSAKPSPAQPSSPEQTARPAA